MNHNNSKNISDLPTQLIELVSHDTDIISRLQNYVQQLNIYNQNTNLISKNNHQNYWNRHILDSAQLMKIITKHNTILDIGTGAGLPGMILAIIGVKKIILVESIKKKILFLQQVKHLADINTKLIIINKRFENITPPNVDYITARAVTSLTKLLNLVLHCKNSTKYFLFPKGQKIQQEINEAKQKFNFKFNLIPSITNTESAIIKIEAKTLHKIKNI